MITFYRINDLCEIIANGDERIPGGLLDQVLVIVKDTIDQIPIDEVLLKRVSNEIASRVIRGRIFVGVVYTLDASHQCVFLLDPSPRSVEFNGVRLIAWAADEGYVSSDMVSPW